MDATLTSHNISMGVYDEGYYIHTPNLDCSEMIDIFADMSLNLTLTQQSNLIFQLPFYAFMRNTMIGATPACIFLMFNIGSLLDQNSGVYDPQFTLIGDIFF